MDALNTIEQEINCLMALIGKAQLNNYPDWMIKDYKNSLQKLEQKEQRLIQYLKATNSKRLKC